MNETGTTMNNRKDHHNILHAILRALVCLMLLMACVPMAGETVHAATTYTAQGKLVLSASKKKGVEQEKSDMPAEVSIYVNETSDKWEIPDDTYYFTTAVGGTLTIECSGKNIPSNSYVGFSIYDSETTDGYPVIGREIKPSVTGTNSGSISISTVLSPGTYIISSYAPKKASATLSVYFLPTVNSITLPDTTLQTGDSVSLKDVLDADPEEYISYCKSQATWTSSNKKVVTVSKKGEVTAKSAGTAKITMKNPDGTKAACTITVTDPVEDATEITPTTVQLSKDSYTYSGKANKPKVAVLDQDGNEIPSDLVAVSYYNNIDAGTAKVLVTVSAGASTQEDGTTLVYHAATLTQTYTIKAATAKKVTVPKSSVAYKYTAKRLTGGDYFTVLGQDPQKVTVYDSKGKKIDASNYTVSYSSTKHAGKVKVTVQMNKNYGKKKLTTSYTIKVNSKTTKLFPKRTYYKYSDGDTSASYSYTKMSAKNLKKLLPYGDKDVIQDKAYDWCAYSDRAIYREIKGYGSGEQSLKFTGTIGDLIQCCIQSKITKIEVLSNDSDYKRYEVTGEDGAEYDIIYNGERFGIKNGYIEVEITGSCPTTYAYIKP
jgi:hypothetical protein